MIPTVGHQGVFESMPAFTGLFISATAWRALAPAKRRLLESWEFNVHSVELDEIEKAGGSLRCCVGEIF